MHKCDQRWFIILYYIIMSFNIKLNVFASFYSSNETLLVICDFYMYIDIIAINPSKKKK